MKETYLVLITNHFPFGQGEAFLAHELPYLTTKFDKTLIVTKNNTSEQTHILPENVIVERISSRSTFMQDIRTLLACLSNFTRFFKLLQQEVRYTHKRNKKRITAKALQFLFKSFELKLTLEGLLKKHRVEQSICFYSYWANNSALAITLLTCKSSIAVCRAHGGDLYEYRQTDGYLPFRLALAERLARVFPISRDGERYLKNLVNVPLHPKIEFAYLGSQHPEKIQQLSMATFTLVSCSNLIALKRVHLIIEALALIEEHVVWVHFGDGPLKAELLRLVNQKLSAKKNISVSFKGFTPNSEILNFYSQNQIGAFINTSMYEGIPVSMMEAQSAGIPIIGTDVGAVNEIVTPLTGKLLSRNPTPEEVATGIRDLMVLPKEKMQTLRLDCEHHWARNFNAANNLSTFASNLKLLLNEAPN